MRISSAPFDAAWCRLTSHHVRHYGSIKEDGCAGVGVGPIVWLVGLGGSIEVVDVTQSNREGERVCGCGRVSVKERNTLRNWCAIVR